MEKEITKYALLNAIKFDGKANPGAVMGKLISEHPELKQNAKELSKKVLSIVKEINKLSLGEQKKKFSELFPEYKERKKKEKEKDLPPLKKVKYGKIVTRIAPEPSKHIHLGHALSFVINYYYAKRYGGKCILRFEDTNPATAKKEFYKEIEKDIKWLKINYDKKLIVSNHMPIFYKYAKKLIEKGNAYVCFCPKEKMDRFRQKSMICDCRENSVEKNLIEWKKMLSKKYKEGECTLRLKGIMDSFNAVMRDPVIFRICKEKHPIQGKKYAVWPMYDFENAIEDSINGVTHIFRSSEFGTMRVELQNYIKELLNLKKQEVVQYTRFNVIGAITKGREIRKLIKEKKVIGWDDPRLVTIKALRRRGIQPETFHELIKEVGISLSSKNIDFSLVASINRKILDPITPRYFFVANPKLIKIKNAPKMVAEIEVHPDKPEMGKRKLIAHDKFYVSDDIKKGKIYRLKHLFNFKDFKFISTDYIPQLNAEIIHWLPADKKQLVKAEILMPDCKLIKGFAEKSVKRLKIGSIVQFERFGFCRLDKKLKNSLRFWFTHK